MEKTDSCGSLDRMRFPVFGVRKTMAGNALSDAIKEDIDNRGCVEREDLAQQETAYHRDSERMAQFRSQAGSNRERNPTQQCGHRGHHDGTKAQQARLIDRVEDRK